MKKQKMKFTVHNKTSNLVFEIPDMTHAIDYALTNSRNGDYVIVMATEGNVVKKLVHYKDGRRISREGEGIVTTKKDELVEKPTRLALFELLNDLHEKAEGCAARMRGKGCDSEVYHEEGIQQNVYLSMIQAIRPIAKGAK